MGIFRVIPQKDTSIMYYAPNNLTIVSASNHGSSPALNIFARKNVVGSNELSRVLLKFDITELSGKIYNDETIPSTNVSYILKMYNMEHGEGIPSSYDLFVYPLSRSFDEGSGLDDDNLKDEGYANWINATSTVPWSVTGSDFISNGYGSASQHFDFGNEDLEVDITTIVQSWLGGLPNNGLLIKLGSSEEDNNIDYLYKMFHGRETKYIDRLPHIEARWSNVLKDNRNNFALDNNNLLCFYSVKRGILTAVNEPVTVTIKDALISSSYVSTVTAGQLADGILTASVNISSTGSYRSTSFYDIWTSGSVLLGTGSFELHNLTGSVFDDYREFEVNINNLKRVYSEDEEQRLNVNVRNLNYVTHRGTVASASLNIEREYMENMYYSIVNDETGDVVIPFGTASSNPYTQLSYDGNGNYFDFFMKNLIPGFKYRIKFLIEFNKYDKKVVDNDFCFKVV